MKKLLIALLAMVMFVPAFAGKKADKQTMAWRYEVQDLGKVAKDGKSVMAALLAVSQARTPPISPLPQVDLSLASIFSVE